MKKACIFIIVLMGIVASAAAQISIVSVTTTPVTCNGGADGSVTISVTGGQAPYFFTIFSLPNMENHISPAVMDTFYTFSNVKGYKWTIYVEDDNGTEISDNVTVSQPSAVKITSVSTIPITCTGYADGEISVAATGESGSFIYTLNPGGLTNGTGQFTNIVPGSYTVEVTDAAGCPSSDVTAPLSFTDPAAISVLSESATDISCNGSNDGQVIVRGTGGTGAYTYTLNPGALQTNGSGNFTGLSQGIYTVDITDVNGCPSAASSPLTVNEPTAIQITAQNKTNITCNGAADGTISVSASGGNAPYQFTLTPGNISNATGNFTNVGPGTYTVSVTDANGCGPVVSNNLVVSQPAALTIVSVNRTNITCHDLNNGTITATSSGGTAPVTYTLNPGGVSNQTGIFNNLPGGSYTVSINDAGGCGPVTSAPVTITNPPALSITSATKTDIDCNGAANGTITVVAAGGTGTRHYTLTPGSVTNTTGVFSNLGAGVYTVSVTDDNACAAAVTAPLTINEPAALTITSATATDITCAGDANGTVSVTATGGTSPYLFKLTPGGNTNATGNFTNLQPGTYTVSVTGAGGCPAVNSNPLTVNEPLAIAVQNVTSSDITCNGNNNGEIHVTGSGGTAPLSYTLNPGAVNNATGDFTGLSGATYTVSISDANGCAAVNTQPVEITDPAAISISSVTAVPVSCNGNTDGTITVVAAGGTGILHYTLNPGAVTNTSGIFSGLAGGSYSVSVTDDNACVPANTGPVAIIEPAAISAAVDGTSILALNCNGDTGGKINITVSGGTAPLTFAWSGPSGYTSGNEDIASLAAGDYNLTITDINGCSTDYQPLASITEPPALTISLSATDVTCNGDANGTITVTAGGGTPPYSYSRNGITYQASNVFSGLIKNMYRIYVRDAGNCSVNDTITIHEPNELQVASEIRIDNNKCYGDQLGEIRILSVVGGESPYQYSIDNGANFSTNPVFLNLGAGSYQTMVKDANGCTAQGNNNLINQPSKIRITNYAQVDVSGCFDNSNGQIAVEATGGTGTKNYRLDSGTPNLTGIFNSLTGGDHVISITDANSCVRDTIVTIGRPAQIVFTGVTLTDVTGCSGNNNGSVDITATGGTGALSFAIDGSAFGPSGTFNGLTAGNHNVSVRDANNCQADTILSLNEPLALSLDTLYATNITCNGNDDGTLTVNAGGGTGPYTYTLLPGGTFNSTGSFAGLTPGTYTVDISDSQGCGPLTTQPVDITEPAPVSIDSVSTTGILCNGDDNATIHIYASGGSAPYSYSIDDETNYSNDPAFTGIVPGTYYLSLQDANSCKIYIDTLTIDEPPALTVVNQSKVDVTTCSDDSTGSINYELTGGTGMIEYSLDGTSWQSGSDFIHLPGGSYTVLTRDENGCSNDSPEIVINSPSPITATITTTPALDESNKGSITISNASGGTGLLTFSVNGMSGPFGSDNVFTDLDAADYDVVILDENGCTLEQTVTVSSVPPLTVSVITENISCNGAGDGRILMTALDATGQAAYSIDDSTTWQTDGTFEGLTAGDYFLFVRDEEGRYFSDTVTIFEPEPLNIMSAVSPASCSSMSTDGAIDITVSGAAGNVTYAWSNGAITEDLNDITAGNYSLTILDENGCQATGDFVVPAITIVNADAGADTTVCAGTVLTLHGTGGTNVTWSPTEGLSNPNLPDPVVTIDTAVTYVLTVTGMNDCNDIDTVTISVFPMPGLTAGNDTIMSGDRITLNAFGRSLCKLPLVTG